MAEVLTTKETLAALENIIKGAEKYICIFTFNIKIDPNYLARLRNAGKRGDEIKVVFGVDNGDNHILEELLAIPKCKVHFKEYLHAKFFYNEKELLIGSMNLSEASAKNNFELGVLFKGEEYSAIIKKVKKEASEIITDSIEWAELNKQKQTKSQSSSFTYNSKNQGRRKAACIRCGHALNFNPEKPLCSTCYYEWAEWENEYYIETFCHSCGEKKQDISFIKPKCYSCYSKN